MQLPSFGINWKNYRITTPTFRLSPVEKPDLSPFLIHMTGKNSLVKILKGENIPTGHQLPEKHGWIKSSIPQFDTSSSQYYNSPVVCFTETPIFALDFFRYRSFKRWDNDQQYGIGFSKESLIRRDVRPVVYLDTQTNRDVLNICNKSENNDIRFSEDEQLNNKVKETLKKIKPLLFPLLENETYQGFMWEREWRYPHDSGFEFHHALIKVICCPSNEKNEIVQLLGEYTNSIEIVESWREYDEVTSYLKRRRKEYDMESAGQKEKIEQISNMLTLTELKEKNEQTLHTLDAYYSVFKETVNSLENRKIDETILSLKQTSAYIEMRIEQLRLESKKKSELERKNEG